MMDLLTFLCNLYCLSENTQPRSSNCFRPTFSLPTGTSPFLRFPLIF